MTATPTFLSTQSSWINKKNLINVLKNIKLYTIFFLLFILINALIDLGQGSVTFSQENQKLQFTKFKSFYRATKFFIVKNACDDDTIQTPISRGNYRKKAKDWLGGKKKEVADSL